MRSVRDRGTDGADPVLAPAIREADHEQPCVRGRLDYAGLARLDQARFGHDPDNLLHQERCARQQPACVASPDAGSASVPSRRKVVPSDDASQAASSIADQSCSAPPNGVTTGPSAAPVPAVRRPTSHGARSSRDANGSSSAPVVEKLPRRLREDEINWLLGREQLPPLHLPRRGVGGDTARNASRDDCFALLGERGRRRRELVGARSEADEDQLTARSCGDRASAIASRSAQPALVTGEDEDRARAVSGRTGCSSASSGSWRRIARSSSRRNGDGSIPSSASNVCARAAVDVERVCLPAGSVEGAHQRADEALVKRMGTDERLQLGDELGIAAEREIGVDPPLERSKAGGRELLDVRLGEHVVCEVGERLAPPQTECLSEQSLARLGVGAVRLGNQPLETEQVELLRLEPDQIARLLGDDCSAFAEPLLSRETWYCSALAAAVGGSPRPHRFGEAVDRYRSVRREQEQGEQRALLRPAERDQRRLCPRPRVAPGSGTPLLASRSPL